MAQEAKEMGRSRSTRATGRVCCILLSNRGRNGAWRDAEEASSGGVQGDRAELIADAERKRIWRRRKKGEEPCAMQGMEQTRRVEAAGGGDPCSGDLVYS